MGPHGCSIGGNIKGVPCQKYFSFAGKGSFSKIFVWGILVLRNFRLQKKKKTKLKS